MPILIQQKDINLEEGFYLIRKLKPNNRRLAEVWYIILRTIYHYPIFVGFGLLVLSSVVCVLYYLLYWIFGF